MKPIIRHFLRAGVLATLALTGAAQAQDAYPNRPIKIIVGLAPGASTDFIAREMSRSLSERLKVPVVVENKPGANTIIASNQVAKAAPDGYTLLLSNSMNATNPWVYDKLPYDYRKDLKNIVLIGVSPNLMTASPKLGINNLQEMIAFAKKKPNEFSYGSAGVGSIHHLLMAIIAQRANIQLNHIPYKGAMGAVQDVLGGNLSGYFGTITSQRDFVKRGDLKPLFVTTATRSKYMPEVPTLAENGLHGLETGYWLGLSGPAGLPPAVVILLNKEVNEILKMPAVIERLERQTISAAGGSPADMDKYFENELRFWKEAASAAKIVPTAVN